MRIIAKVLQKATIVPDSIIEFDDEGLITGVFEKASGPIDFEFSGLLAVPGFVDLHVHGAGGADFMDGTVEAVRTAARTHARFGTTSLLATTLTAERDKIDRSLSAITEVIESPAHDEAAIRGIHLEGPYICRNRRGAQPEGPIRSPDIAELDHWINLSKGWVKQITLAPEIPGAVHFIEHASRRGINVSIGHTDASSSEVNSAIFAGARMGTHLFNAMSPMTHRSPGAVGALLADDRTYCELICDGFHVDKVVVKVAVQAKGVDRIVLITDAMSGTAMPDGDYQLGGTKVIVDRGTARFVDGTLAGSVLTMNGAFNNVQNFAGLSIEDAVKVSSLNAANLIGLGSEIGSIEQGKKGDITILDQAAGSQRARLLQ